MVRAEDQIRCNQDESRSDQKTDLALCVRESIPLKQVHSTVNVENDLAMISHYKWGKTLQLVSILGVDANNL